MGNPMRELMLMIVLLLSILQKVITQVTLIDPPGRSTLWRQGFNSAVNHHDDQLFCGGYRVGTLILYVFVFVWNFN